MSDASPYGCDYANQFTAPQSLLEEVSLAILQFILMTAKLGNNFIKSLFHLKFGEVSGGRGQKLNLICNRLWRHLVI